MANTIRDLSELLVLFADNNSNQITAQDLRDFIVTTNAWRFSGDYNDLQNQPDLGTISSQDYDNVNITGGILTNVSFLGVSGSINPGLVLPLGAFSTTKVSVRSPLVNFKSTGATEILTVPVNYMFLIDGMEVLTTSITGLNSSLHVGFGSLSNSVEYYSSSQVYSNSIGERHLVEVPQNASVSGKIVTITVTTPSSADLHEGFGILHGTLVKIT